MTDWTEIQNGDGGWAYARGGSWTEPTVFALLAQFAAAADRTALDTSPSLHKGFRFLRSTQREDGGWSPRQGVDQSTWVTALAALLPEAAIGGARLRRAISWLVGQTGRESSWSWKIRQRLAGNHDEFPEGIPWFPGAAAWVIPTSFGILAFERALTREDDADVRERILSGRKFLFDHICADGGWNHGSNKALGRDGDSYPETTGIALLALHGAEKSAALGRGIAAARRHLGTCHTAEGTAWLRMGLAAQGEITDPGSPTVQPTPRNNMDTALLAIASAPRNPLLVKVAV